MAPHTRGFIDGASRGDYAAPHGTSAVVKHFAEAADELNKVLSDEMVADVPMLVLGNTAPLEHMHCIMRGWLADTHAHDDAACVWRQSVPARCGDARVQ